MTRHDPVRRPGLVTEALRHRGLLSTEADEDTARDVLAGGHATSAPRTDAESFAADEELVGAGPEEQEDFVYGRVASPDS